MSSNHKKRKNLLVFGYIRENTINQQEIPIALIKLFEVFYDDLIDWKIKGKQFDEHFKHRTDVWYKQIYGPIFNIGSIEFQLAMIRRTTTSYWADIGNIQQHINFVLIMNAKLIPTNINKFDIDITMDGNIFTDKYQKQYQLQYIPHSICPFIQNGQYIFGNPLAFNEFKVNVDDLDEIDLNFSVELIDIQYNKMNIHCMNNWDLDEQEIKIWNESIRNKCCYLDKSIKSKIFNNWRVDIKPFDQINVRSGNRTIIIIKPVLLPYNIKYFVVKCDLKIESDDGDKIEFNHHAKCFNNDGGMKYYWLCSRFVNVNTISVWLDIHIKEIYDKNNNKIHIDQWKQYGFVQQ